ncbi:hypothetical protein [uncultured Amnibacterium sp.]|uniref:hypothetical protein n=1 Tax=uncultured Amnibacterium sp. TaxID=1631851 RepID=UPI0035CC9C7F
MDSTASAALITSIVAVVLAALGLVGGVIGYVQGTAALRRATLIRQRATAAEEAALQARTQAEQAVRSAQQIVDRLNALQVRSLGDVADQPTGPLMLPSRLVAAPLPSAFAFAPPGSAPVPSSTPEPEGSIARPAVEVPVAAPFASLARAEPSAEPRLTLVPEPHPQQPDPAEDRRAEEMPAASASAAAPEQQDPKPESPLEPATETERERERESEPSASATTESVEEPAPAPAPVQAPTLQRAPTPAPEPLPAPQPAATPAPVPAPEPPARSATGQVTAGLQDSPPLDWAEALRTGAIPLPAVSRGTYSAPRKGKDAPVRFELRAVGRQRYEAVNVGGATAQQATVEGTGDDSHLVHPVETVAKAIGPGEALAFSVLRVEGRRISVRVTWLREGGRPTSIDLPLP